MKVNSDSVLGLSTGTARMSCVSVTTELQHLGCRNLEDVFESGTQLHQIVFTPSLACRPSPETNSVESLTNVDHDTHHLIVSIVFQCLTDTCKLSM